MVAVGAVFRRGRGTADRGFAVVVALLEVVTAVGVSTNNGAPACESGTEAVTVERFSPPRFVVATDREASATTPSTPTTRRVLLRCMAR